MPVTSQGRAARQCVAQPRRAGRAALGRTCLSLPTPRNNSSRIRGEGKHRLLCVPLPSAQRVRREGPNMLYPAGERLSMQGSAVQVCGRLLSAQRVRSEGPNMLYPARERLSMQSFGWQAAQCPGAKGRTQHTLPPARETLNAMAMWRKTLAGQSVLSTRGSAHATLESAAPSVIATAVRPDVDIARQGGPARV